MTATHKYIAVLLCLVLSVAKALSKNVMENDNLSINTVLFKITNPATQKTSYLFGTHHAFGKSFFDSLIVARQLLSSADLFIKENLNIPGHLAEDIINDRTAATKWRQYLGKEDFEFVTSIFSASGVDFNKMTPTELYVFLNRYFKERVCLAKDTTDSYLSLDDYMGAIARESDIKLLGLETTEQQIELINRDVAGMPRSVHKKRLSRIIDKIKSKNSQDCAETAWYSQMDIDYQWSQPCQNSLVLTDRNNKWMKTIQRYLATNNCFIAVGLSHLMYECGLVNQLRDMGYTITPIEVK